MASITCGIAAVKQELEKLDANVLIASRETKRLLDLAAASQAEIGRLETQIAEAMQRRAELGTRASLVEALQAYRDAALHKIEASQQAMREAVEAQRRQLQDRVAALEARSQLLREDHAAQPSREQERACLLEELEEEVQAACGTLRARRLKSLRDGGKQRQRLLMDEYTRLEEAESESCRLGVAMHAPTLSL
jgi:hypothetical protein